MVKVLQLNVEVSTCQLPPFITDQYEEYLLTVALNQELSANTSWKAPNQCIVDFATRLFIRLDKINLDQTPEVNCGVMKCTVTLTGLTPGRSKVEVAKGTVFSKTDGCHKMELKVEGRKESGWVDLEFTCGMVEVKESKSSINRSNSFKAGNHQKQSSSHSTESPEVRTATNFHSRASLAHTDSRESLNSSQLTAKVSKVQIQENPSKEQLQNSVVTSRPQFKVLDDTGRCEQTTTLLSLQIRIDQLQQALTQLTTSLCDCTKRLQCAELSLNLQKSKTIRLSLQKQELLQLLTIQQTKSKLAFDHMSKLSKMYEQLHRGEDSGAFELIEEKDQIIMLNQELEIEVSLKQNVIEQLKNEIQGLKDKISGLEIRPVSILPSEPSSIKKMQQLPGRELEKIKSEKRLTDRKSSTWNKKQEDTKDTVNKAKDKEPERRKTKKDMELKPSPAVPAVRHPRDSKTNNSIRNQQMVSPRIPKGKGVPKATLKVEQKGPTDTSHKKSITSSQITDQLMINSRNVETEKSAVKH